MHVAVVGATGLVGKQLLRVLDERKFPLTRLTVVASERSIGNEVETPMGFLPLGSVSDALKLQPDLVFFAAGGEVSRTWGPRFVAQGSVVIDKSSAFRQDLDVPLVVPEVNGDTLGESLLVANPNCSTSQLVMVLYPLHRTYGLRRVVVTTYQAVSGTGTRALEQLGAERSGTPVDAVYPHPIHNNVLPHCDRFLPNGYTAEEMKLVHETRRILGLPELAITATAVRVPVQVGHCEAVNVALERSLM